MRPLRLFFLGAILSASLFAWPARTVEGHAACFSERWLNDMAHFVGGGDAASLLAYLESKKCVMLQGDLPVTVVEERAPGKVRFVHRGASVWTVSEGVAPR